MIYELQKAFLSQANESNAEKQKAYLKDLFPFIGLPKPLRASLQKTVFSSFAIKEEKELFEIVLKLWEQEEREFHYAALDLAIKHRKLLTKDSLSFLEKLIRQNSWWDTVDAIASNLLGHVLYKYPDQLFLMDEWIDDPHMWIRRSALLFQLKWKLQTDEKKLFSYCEKTMAEKEFFIRKAIGWVLREYSKSNSQAVKAFIEKNSSKMSGLSLREGSKYL